jgi:hypothetical protein
MTTFRLIWSLIVFEGEYIRAMVPPFKVCIVSSLHELLCPLYPTCRRKTARVTFDLVIGPSQLSHNILKPFNRSLGHLQQFYRAFSTGIYSPAEACVKVPAKNASRKKCLAIMFDRFAEPMHISCGGTGGQSRDVGMWRGGKMCYGTNWGGCDPVAADLQSL